MQLKLLVVLEVGPSAMKLAAYLARVCSGATGPNLSIVLFIEQPGLPTWVESGESSDVATQRRRFEAEAQERTAGQLAEVRRYLVQHGISDDVIAEEIAESSDLIVPDILASSHQHGCDTIVMARHHKSMMREFFEGDSEERLLRHPTGFSVWLVE